MTQQAPLPDLILEPLVREHIGLGLAEVGLARDPRGLRLQPDKERIHQQAGHILTHGTAMIRFRATEWRPRLT